VLSHKDNPAHNHARAHARTHAHAHTNAKPSWLESTSTLEMVVTLIDEDPFSYTSAAAHNTTTNANTNTNANAGTHKLPSSKDYKHYNLHN
jgi:hypothetical protein